MSPMPSPPVSEKRKCAKPWCYTCGNGLNSFRSRATFERIPCPACGLRHPAHQKDEPPHDK